mmetsp:Transcript_4022/g.6176  ORF Transcript_4022/g.6176 Transcript_4022/m.6176 type:complete len:328 (-) Transcript_4022:489-1472(-)
MLRTSASGFSTTVPTVDDTPPPPPAPASNDTLCDSGAELRRSTPPNVLLKSPLLMRMPSTARLGPERVIPPSRSITPGCSLKSSEMAGMVLWPVWIKVTLDEAFPSLPSPSLKRRLPPAALRGEPAEDVPTRDRTERDRPSSSLCPSPLSFTLTPMLLEGSLSARQGLMRMTLPLPSYVNSLPSISFLSCLNLSSSCAASSSNFLCTSSMASLTAKSVFAISRDSSSADFLRSSMFRTLGPLERSWVLVGGALLDLSRIEGVRGGLRECVEEAVSVGTGDGVAEPLIRPVLTLAAGESAPLPGRELVLRPVPAAGAAEPSMLPRSTL